MPSLANEMLLDRIAAALGMTRDDFDHIVPASPPAHWLFVDGTPDQCAVWANQVLEPEARQRLVKIAAIINVARSGP